MLRHPPGLVQRSTAYFLSLGHYDAMIRRMGRVLAERRALMEEAIAAHGLEIAGRGAFGGSSFWMRAPEGTDTAALARKLEREDVLIEPGAPFFAGRQAPSEFYRLAWSSIPSERIPEGVARLARALA